MSRSRVALLGVVLMLATAGVAPVAPVAAQTPPSITLTPNCADPNTRPDVRVDGSGFRAGDFVGVFFDSQSVGGADADAGGRFTFVINSASLPRTGWYQVMAQDDSNNRAVAPFRAPCSLSPRVVLRPTCGAPTKSQLTIEAFDMPPGDVDIWFDRGGPNAVNEPGGFADDTGHVAPTLLDIAPSSSRNYPVEVNDYGVYGVTARAIYQVPCPPPTTTTAPTTTSPTTTTTTEDGPSSTTSTTQSRGTTTVPTTTTTSTTIPPTTPGATLTVSPGVGAGGLVAKARGTGFPPGTVTLIWLPGLGVTQAVAAQDGVFETQVLVFPNDRLGPRSLVATAGPTTASAPFVVVPDTMQPSGREVAQIIRAHRFLFR